MSSIDGFLNLTENNGLNGVSNDSNQLLTNGSQNVVFSSNTDDLNQCKNGLFLPFWGHNNQTEYIVFHGIVYFLALMYTFVGVAIIADRFMSAIEQVFYSSINYFFKM